MEYLKGNFFSTKNIFYHYFSWRQRFWSIKLQRNYFTCLLFWKHVSLIVTTFLYYLIRSIVDKFPDLSFKFYCSYTCINITFVIPNLSQIYFWLYTRNLWNERLNPVFKHKITFWICVLKRFTKVILYLKSWCEMFILKNSGIQSILFLKEKITKPFVEKISFIETIINFKIFFGTLWR